MRMTRRLALGIALTGLVASGTQVIAAGSSRPPEAVLRTWYKLVLELVRHTATYSPPVASRAFAYLGVTAFEATASGNPKLRSLQGQLNRLDPAPAREAGVPYDEGVVINAAMRTAVENFFSNTGPTGQRAMGALGSKLAAEVAANLPQDVVARSEAHGKAIADHVIAWSASDGGAVIENMGFPYEYTLTAGPGRWVPTSPIKQQQVPLLPNWGNNRTFAMRDGAACPLPPPPAYSEDVASTFYKEAFEVYETVKTLTPAQREIARFWSDDPMLSPTPPGHWLVIALSVLEAENAGLDRTSDLLARLGVALADAFIACWKSKFEFDLVRPITYIRRVIDPKWEAILITPPFPEYPSGHSTQSAAAATVLTAFFGENFAFVDTTHERDGLRPRSFSSFWAAADEAGISRLYGGIHFRAAIERGLEQGRCVGAATNALQTRI